jgi:hypothetical protein
MIKISNIHWLYRAIKIGIILSKIDQILFHLYHAPEGSMFSKPRDLSLGNLFKKKYCAEGTE